MPKPNDRTITAPQYSQLKFDIESDNRVAFYSHLFQYTGSTNALMMAKISSGSGVVGGLAWAGNLVLQKEFPKAYEPGGVATFSRTIAVADLRSIKIEADMPGIYTVPSEAEMLRAAHRVWIDRGIGDYFFGLPLLSMAEAAEGNFFRAAELATVSKTLLSSIIPMLKEPFGELADSRLNYGKSIQECLDQNPYAITRVFTGHGQQMTEVVAKDGKSVCVFSQAQSLPLFDKGIDSIKGIISSFKISQTADGEQTVTWTDLDGAHGTDVYRSNGQLTYLDRADVTLLTANGGTARGIYDVNPDGGLQNRQLNSSAANGNVHASLSGANVVSHLDNATIALDPNSSATLFGSDNTIAIDSAGIWLNTFGADNNVVCTMSGNTIGFSGLNQAFSGQGNTVWFNQGTAGKVTGSANTVVTNGAGVRSEISGSDTHVISTGPNNVIGLSGDRQHVRIDAGTVWLDHGADGAMIGSRNTLVANGAAIQAEVIGSDTNLISKAAGNTFGLTGDRQSITGEGVNIWLNSGTDVVAYGGKNLLVANGTDVQMTIYGSETNLVSHFAGNTFGLTGDRQHVTANANTIWFESNADGRVHGTHNTVVANGQHIQMRVDGSDTNLLALSNACEFKLTGDRQTVRSNDNVIQFNSGTDGNIYGWNNTLVAAGTDIQAAITGDNATIFSQGLHNSFYLSGNGHRVHAFNSYIWLTPGTNVTVIGGGNRVMKSSDNEVNWIFEPVPPSLSTLPGPKPRFDNPHVPEDAFPTEWYDLPTNPDNTLTLIPRQHHYGDA